MVGRSVGRRGVGWRRAMLDGGQRTVGSFYSFLVIPDMIANLSNLWKNANHRIRIHFLHFLKNAFEMSNIFTF